MEFIKPGINLNIIGKRYIAFAFSAILILVSIGSLIIHRGPNYGIDFAGGTIIQIKCQKPVTIENFKSGLVELGLDGSAVQRFGEKTDNEFLVHTNQTLTTDKGFSEQIKIEMEKTTGAGIEIRRIEMVGPQVGKDLQEKALFALFYTLLFITIYISGRFEQKWVISAVMAAALIGAVFFFTLFNVSIPFLIAVALIVTLILFWQLRLKYAMGAVVALMHDVFITIGVFSILDIEFSLPIIAALLTIVGYSLNDTIIVYDRIRENIKRYNRLPGDEIINKSINETLSRTILTSLTTLIVLSTLFFLGGDIIHDFSLALIVGIIIGTYSSIYVASPILLLLKDEGGAGGKVAVSAG
jgi:preprotein translocase subunit SecF